MTHITHALERDISIKSSRVEQLHALITGIQNEILSLEFGLNIIADMTVKPVEEGSAKLCENISRWGLLTATEIKRRRILVERYTVEANSTFKELEFLQRNLTKEKNLLSDSCALTTNIEALVNSNAIRRKSCELTGEKENVTTNPINTLDAQAVCVESDTNGNNAHP